jgi:hypothetical protein
MNSAETLLVSAIILAALAVAIFYLTKGLSAAAKMPPKARVEPKQTDIKPPKETDKEWENPLIL